MNRQVALRIALVAVVLGAAVVGFAGSCDQAQAQAPERVEIRDVQGGKLGSVDDFRENSIKGPQVVDAATYLLVVDGMVEQSRSYTITELGHLPHQEKVVELVCVEGWRVKALWSGICLSRLFDDVVPLASANTVIFHAADGYTTSLSLATILERELIVADKINGMTLPQERGFPLQLVAQDKLGYKWAKWIVRIELSDDPSYRGTWESRGYSNDADLKNRTAPERNPAPAKVEQGASSSDIAD